MTKTIRPGEVWCDTNGQAIQAHGGGLLRTDDGTYFWYGENKNAPNVPGKERVDIIGIACYSSHDLVNWENRGIVLSAVPGDESHDLFPANVLERPKVVRAANGEYVLWVHMDSPDYKKASLGVAASTNPEGPFRYLYSFRPEGRDSRDMTVFQDTDGVAFVFFSSEGVPVSGKRGTAPNQRQTFYNVTLRIARLTSDCRMVEGETVEAFPGEMREAPAVWKWKGRYYMVTSGCTGWRPNPALWHVADHPMGPWRSMGDPISGTGQQKATTFEAQSTFVLPIPSGRELSEDAQRFIFCADRWNPHDLQDSRYVWLPLTMRADGSPHIEWQDEWTPMGGGKEITMGNKNAAASTARRQFDQQAAFYDNRWASWSDEALKAVLALADPRPHWRALDIATGTGFTALALAPHVHDIVGTDISPGMLEQAARHAKQAGVLNVSWREARADAQPFPGEYFDLVTCRIAPHHFTDIPAFLAEVVRVLRAGGVFVLGDTTVPDKVPEAAFWQNTVEKMRDPSHARNLSPEEWRAACVKAGLKVTDLDVLTEANSMELSPWLETAGCIGIAAGAVRQYFADAPRSAREQFQILQENDETRFTWQRIVLRALCP